MNTSKSLFLATVLLATACSQPAAEPQEGVGSAAIERVEVSTEITEGVPVTFADLKIDGMTCEQMCGGSIKKALAALPGISSTEINFDAPDGDHAVVTYDPTTITDGQMIEAIQKLHEGQYKVLAVTITKQVKVEGPVGQESTGKVGGSDVQAAAATAAKAAEAVSAIPGILEMLSAIIRR